MDHPVSPSSPRERDSDFATRDDSNRYGTGGSTIDPAYNPLQRHPSSSSLSSEGEDGDERSELHYYLAGPPQRNPSERIPIPRESPPARPTVHSSLDSGRTSLAPVKPTPPGHWVQVLDIVSPVAMMAGLFLLGMGFAVGHYVFYRSWRDHIVDGNLEQEYIIRAGTAFAFLSKASLVGAVIIAHKQIAWDTVGKRAITIDGVNAMFVAPTDLTSFWNGDMLQRAKTATILALLTWYVGSSRSGSLREIADEEE